MRSYRSVLIKIAEQVEQQEAQQQQANPQPQEVVPPNVAPEQENSWWDGLGNAWRNNQTMDYLGQTLGDANMGRNLGLAGGAALLGGMLGGKQTSFGQRLAQAAGMGLLAYGAGRLYDWYKGRGAQQPQQGEAPAAEQPSEVSSMGGLQLADRGATQTGMLLPGTDPAAVAADYRSAELTTDADKVKAAEAVYNDPSSLSKPIYDINDMGIKLNHSAGTPSQQPM